MGQAGPLGCFAHCSVGRDSAMPYVSQRWLRKNRQPLPCLPLLGWPLGAYVVFVLVAGVERTQTSGPGLPPLCFLGKPDRRKLGQTSSEHPAGTKILWVCWATPVCPFLYLSFSHLCIHHAFLLSQISKRMGTFLRSRGYCQCHTQQVALIDWCRAIGGEAAVHSQGSLPLFSLPVACGSCRVLFWVMGVEVSEGYEGSLCL